MESNGLVLDASVVSKWYLRDEELVDAADGLFARWVDGEWAAVCPGHFPFEVTSAVLRAGRMGRLSRVAVRDGLAAFASLLPYFQVIAPQLLVRESAELGASLGVSFFDACYLQTARVQGASLITADAAFYRQTAMQPDVIWLGDFGK